MNLEVSVQAFLFLDKTVIACPMCSEFLQLQGPVSLLFPKKNLQLQVDSVACVMIDENKFRHSPRDYLHLLESFLETNPR